MEKIKEILKLKTWSLEEFAWICAGFSPFDHPMNLTRLVDGAEVICGSVDYIAAKSEYDKYLGIVFWLFSARSARKPRCSRWSLYSRW